MSNPPPVKTPLSKPSPGTPAGTAASASVETAPELATDPKLDALVRLLRPVAEPKIHEEAEALLATATRMEVSLTTHRLSVLHGDRVLVEAALATGRSLSPTPEGTFTLAARPGVPSALRYGHYRSKSGALLVRGVFPAIDPAPAEAVFDPIQPKGVLQLSGDGPLVFGGEATGAATSDGSLVLPDKVALLLHETLPLGLTVVIGR